MRKCYLVACTIALVGSQFITASALAETTTMMDEVVVTASRIEETKKTVTANVSVISREEILQSPSKNIGDLLAEKNIGHVNKYPGNTTTIGIRGFRSSILGDELGSKVLILLDGRRAGTANIGQFLTRNVERVEILRGPGSVQYGASGMGGVVNIITKQGAKNSLFVEGGAGSFDTYEGSVGGEFKVNNFDFAGSFTYGTRGDYDTGSGATYKNTGVDYETGLSANLGYTFSERHRVGVIVNHFDSNENGDPGYLAANDLVNYTDKSNYSVDFQYAGAAAQDKYHWQVRYFFGKDEQNWSSWGGSFNDTDQQGAQAQLSGRLGSTVLTGGLDYLKYEMTNTYNPTAEYENAAMFLLGKTSLLRDRLTVNYGLRYDWYEVSLSEMAGNKDDQTNLTPMVGIAYQLNENLKLRAQYAQGFLMPTAQQLAADYPDGYGGYFRGNPDLDPEKSSTYEGGVDFDLNGLSASLTYFYADYDDKIVTTALSDSVTSYKNIDGATIAGFEMEVAYDLGVPLNWAWEVKPYLGLTLLTEYEDNDTGEDLLYTSGTQFSTGLVVNNGAGIFGRLNVAYTSSQDVENWVDWSGDIIELDSFTVVDLSAGWKFYENDRVGALSVKGDITNLFDEDYAYVDGYPMPGRSFFVSLRWDY